MIPVHIDFETRSECNLKACGAAFYAQHPSTSILCMAYSINNQPTKIIKREAFSENSFLPPGLPAELLPFIMDPQYRFIAHNAFFEECIWEYILHRRFGWPSLMDPKRWACTMAKAAMCNLMLSLEAVGSILNIKERKKAVRGAELVNILCKPQGVDPLGDPVWNDDAQLFEELYGYCMTDVDAEKEVDSRLPELPPIERQLWELDFIINHRGIKADVPAARQAMDMAASLTDRMNVRMLQLSGGMIERVSQPQRVRQWLKEKHNINTDSLDKAQLAFLLRRTDLPQVVREVLYLRSQGGKSSTSKYTKITQTASKTDGRIRGTLQYHGAGTGRWVGRQVQLQNLPKGTERNPEAAIEVIKSGDAEWFEVCYPRPMETLSSCIRGVTVVAEEGHKLVCADYSGIEVAVLMWEADDKDALELLSEGKSLYPPMAEYIYSMPPGTVKKGDPKFAKEYAVGKEVVLGSGYQMWWPRFMEECLKKGIVLGTDKLTGEMTFDNNDSAPESDDVLPWEEGYAEWVAAGGNVGQKSSQKKRFMTEAEVMYKNAIVAYRNKYTKVVGLWKAMEEAAKNAVRNPGRIYSVSKVRWGMDKKREFLLCQLPSGRCLRYFKPFIKAKTTKWGAVKESLHFWGEDSKTKQWSIQHTYGGKLTENVTQAIARDIMGNGMLNCEAAGYPIVLTVHDELIAEILAKLLGTGLGLSLEHFIKCMCDLPLWAAGMPMRAEGWVGERYKK